MISFNEVSESYSGGIGCACGCMGTYQVASHYGIEAANKNCGYMSYDKCSDRSVKSTLSKINKLIDWADPAAVNKYVHDDFAWFETDTRSYVVYFIVKGRGTAIRKMAEVKLLNDPSVTLVTTPTGSYIVPEHGQIVIVS